MFDSGISLVEIISQLNTEADIAYDVPNYNYVLWANALEQFLYTEFIKEQNRVVIENPDTVIDTSAIVISESEAAIRFEDIYAVYADGVQLIKSTVASGDIFPDTFYKINNKMGYNTKSAPSKIEIVYHVKPSLKTVNTNGEISDKNVALPLEFIDLLKAKLRGEAYKLANEDSLAAKWLNDYNVLLETFKVWLDAKKPNFGL